MASGTVNRAKRANGNFYKFLLLCGGGFLAAIGSGMTAFGLGVHVFEQTGLASATTLITLCAFLPGLLMILCGVQAGRYGHWIVQNKIIRKMEEEVAPCTGS